MGKVAIPDKTGGFFNSFVEFCQSNKWEIKKIIHNPNPSTLNTWDNSGKVSEIRFPAPANPRRQPENAKGNFFIKSSNNLFEKSIT